MIKKLSLFLLISSTFCTGQSVLTPSTVDAQPAAQNMHSPMGATGQSSAQGPAVVGGYPTPGAKIPGTPAGFDEEERTLTPPRTARIIGPLTTKSEFEQFAENATGRRLPVYGRLLFDEAPTTFAPVENVPVPADYVLGPGDQLLIRAWGKIELNARVTVDRNGQINLPRVGTLTVAGLHYAQAEAYLHSAIGAIFKDFQLNVTLGQLRSIQIFVLGNARQPGAYTVSSLSTLVDALFTSGGPSATGTMRRIQLRREGQTISEFDIYDLIRRGDKSRDVRLLPGDVIFIPAIGPQIAISGDVNQPGIYELNGDDTAGSVLADAGGITSLADTGRAVLERIENHSNRAVAEFTLDAQGQARPVRDGDLLRVFPLSPKFANAITLRGSVSRPGLYAWKEGMRVSDLIPSHAFLITRDYWNKQNHLVQPVPEHPFSSRTADTPDDPPTDALDNPLTDTVGNPRSGAMSNSRSDAFGDPRPGAMSNSRNDAFGNQRTETSGNSRLSGSEDPRTGVPSYVRTDAADNQRADALESPRTSQSEGAGSRTVASIGQNSAEINWEYALIERLDQHDLSTRLIPFRLASAIDNPASADNQELTPGDVVTVFSRTDLELPMEKHASFVRVGGEVNAPGIYRVNPGDTLRDVVERAGGLTQHSYLYASIFTRVSARKAEETQLRQSAEQMQRELISRYSNATPQAGQTAASQQTQLSMQQSVLAKMTSIKPTGRVVLGMKPEATAIAEIPDFSLEDGDVFYIPPRLTTVQVAGAVYNANAFRYEAGEQLVKYLNDAGGATREADARRTFVIHADGTVISRQSRNLRLHDSYMKMKLLPGDAIVVPEKLRVSSKLAEFLQMSQFMSQLGLTAAAMSVIR